MTEITITVRGDDILGFIASEHSGRGDATGEIVCNGVSALTLTCVLSLVELAKIPEEKMDLEQSEAYLSVRLSDESIDKTTDLIFQTMLVGLRAIEREYENYITIETLEV